MTSAYRSGYEQIVGLRLARRRQTRELATPLMAQLQSIRVARIARSLAGAVGIASALAMALLACTGANRAPTYALVASSVGAIATYVVTRVVLAAWGNVRPFAPPPPLIGQLHVDLATLDATDPLRSLQAINAQLTRLERLSMALPLVALSLLAPLTLHGVFAALVDDSTSARDFTRWICISLVIVGHAHLVLATLAFLFARKMKKASLEDLARIPIHREWAKAWGITVGAAAVPGLVLWLVPPLLTALTGIVFIPLRFISMHKRLLGERAPLSLAEDVPTQIRVAPEDAALAHEAHWSECRMAHRA